MKNITKVGIYWWKNSRILIWERASRVEFWSGKRQAGQNFCQRSALGEAAPLECPRMIPAISDDVRFLPYGLECIILMVMTLIQQSLFWVCLPKHDLSFCQIELAWCHLLVWLYFMKLSYYFSISIAINFLISQKAALFSKGSLYNSHWRILYTA